MNHEKLKICIIEDSKIHIQWLKLKLSKESNLEIASIDTTGRGGIESVKQHHPKIVILDFQLEDMTCLEVAKRIKAFDKNIKIFANTAHKEISFIEKIINDENIDAIGIKGSIFFDNNFIAAINTVIVGGTYVDPSLLNILRDAKKLKGLSELTYREFEVFIQANLGKSNAKIAEDLFVEISHVKNIKSKIAKKIRNDDVNKLLKKLIDNANPDLIHDV